MTEPVSSPDIVESPDFRLTTALLWTRTGNLSASAQDPDLGLLPFHRDRLAAAARAFEWHSIADNLASDDGLKLLRGRIQEHLRSLPEPKDNHVEHRKLRIHISKNYDIEVDSAIMGSPQLAGRSDVRFMPDSLDPPMPAPAMATVFIDTQSVASSAFTTHKTSCRTLYNAVRGRADITWALPMAEEVLLYNERNEVMEASLSTIYLRRNGVWITPAASCGGNLGVSRRLALEKGLCQEGLISVLEVQNGEVVWLSNAVRGFFMGQIRRDEV